MLRLSILFVGMVMVASCAEEQKEKAFKAYKGPIMTVDNLSVTFSDSGKTKITLNTAKQLQFEDQTEFYPKPVFVNFYDKKNVAYTTIRGDSARYLKVENIYKIMGNVFVLNNARHESLSTSELVWNGTKQQIYTNKPVTLKNPYETIHGAGMVANQDFTNVRLRQMSGNIAVDADTLFED